MCCCGSPFECFRFSPPPVVFFCLRVRLGSSPRFAIRVGCPGPSLFTKMDVWACRGVCASHSTVHTAAGVMANIFTVATQHDLSHTYCNIRRGSGRAPHVHVIENTTHLSGVTGSHTPAAIVFGAVSKQTALCRPRPSGGNDCAVQLPVQL